MKTKIIAALAFTLLAGAATQALAQEHNHDHGGDSGGEKPQFTGPREGGHGERGPRSTPSATPNPTPNAAPAATLQSPQGGHARFGAPPPSPDVQARPSGQRGDRFTHNSSPDNARGPERNREVERQGSPQGGGERGWDRNRDAERGRDVDHARGDRRYSGGRDDRRDDHRNDHRDADRRNGHDGRWDGDRHDNGDRNSGGWNNGVWNNGSGWNRGDAPHWQRGRYPSVYYAPTRYHVARYRQPYGYYARAWGYGDLLPQGWFAESYWLEDFLAYGLPYPPPGYVWVRVGDDALMIDRYSGLIAQVVRGVFW